MYKRQEIAYPIAVLKDSKQSDAAKQFEDLDVYKRQEDTETEVSLRPKSLSDYLGQEKVKEQLEIFIEAAKSRNEPLDHVLLYGPPGLGNTTLAGIIANEMGVNLRITSGPAIERAGDLAAILTNLEENDVLFIDEIHRINRSVEEAVSYTHLDVYKRQVFVCYSRVEDSLNTFIY